jgi:hypothetical protein
MANDLGASSSLENNKQVLKDKLSLYNLLKSLGVDNLPLVLGMEINPLVMPVKINPLFGNITKDFISMHKNIESSRIILGKDLLTF